MLGANAMLLTEIADLTAQMLACAKTADFESLAALESQQRLALAQHFARRSAGMLNSDDNLLLTRILDDTNELIAICEGYKHESEVQLRKLQASHKAALEYGANVNGL